MEATLINFFEGRATGVELRRSLQVAGSEPATHSEFHVQPQHLIALISAALDKSLESEDLRFLSGYLQSRDHFLWDADTPEGKRVADALFWLGAPEINWPLTEHVLGRIHDYLVTGRNTLVDTDAAPDAAGA